MRLELLDPVVNAAPGETTSCRMRVVNDGATPASYQLRIVGLRDEPIRPGDGQQLQPGESVDLEMDVRLPRAFAAGRHKIAVELSSDRSGDRPAMAPLTIDVGSIQQVTLDVTPTTIKGHRKGRFKLEVHNREDHDVHLHLSGGGPDVTVKIKPAEIDLRRGDGRIVKGVVRGPRRLVRDPILRTLTITASGNAAPVMTETSFRQRPRVPRRLRTLVAMLVLLALWVGLLVGGVYLWHRHNTKGQASTSTTVAGAAGAPGSATGATTADGGTTNGAPGSNGTPGASTGGNGGGGGGGGGAGGKKKPTAPTSTTIKGTVKAGKTGADAGIDVLIAPAQLDGTSASSNGGQAGASRPVKIWPARHGVHNPAGLGATRQTLSVQTSEAGAWAFPNVALGTNYEVSFKKQGFTTQSVIVTPTPDGKAVTVPPIVLKPGDGGASGVVTGPGGALGGVTIVVTDGTLTYQTTTATDGPGKGKWSIGSISTPGSYTVTASIHSYGTQVKQLNLVAGETAKGVDIAMKQGVGSIAGKVLHGTTPFGGVTITASQGKTSVTTTTLTVGDQGSFVLPDLPLASGSYTVTATAAGYVPQSIDVDLSQNQNPTDVNFTLKSTTASVKGIVLGDTTGPLVAAGVTISQDKVAYRTTTAATPTAGSFEITGLAPGDYVVTFDRFDHATLSQPVKLAAGDELDLGSVTLKFQGQSALATTGQIDLSILDSQGSALKGATVNLVSVSTGKVVQTIADTAGVQNTFSFTKVAIGTYDLQVSRPNYRPVTRRVSVGLGLVNVGAIQLFKLGQIVGHVVNALDPSQLLADYSFRLFRVLPNGSLDTAALQIIANTGGTDASGKTIFDFQSNPSSLTDGTYQLVVDKSPTGYLIKSDQIIDPNTVGAKPMQFTIAANQEDVIKLQDLKAYPFPKLTGKLLAPSGVDATGKTTYASLPGTQGGTTVKLSCGGTSAPAAATLSESVKGSGNFDTFGFTPELLSKNGLLGACTVKVESPGYTTVEQPTPQPLVVSDGTTVSDQSMSIVLAKPATVAGTTRWFDYGVTPGVSRLIPGATVAATAQVITGFTAGAGNSQPTPVFGSVSPSVTDANGAWIVIGQIFGTSTYSVTASGFDNGTVDVNVASDGSTSAPAFAGLEGASANGGALTLTMTPTNRSLSGTVAYVSKTAAPGGAYPVTIVPTGPNLASQGPTAQPSLVSTAPSSSNGGAFSISPARPGTWNVGVSVAANSGYVLRDPLNPSAYVSSFSVPRTLDPTGPLPSPVAFDLVQQGRITVNLVDSGNNPSVLTAVTATLTRTDVTGSSKNGTLSAASFDFPNLDVPVSNPTSNAATYKLALAGADLTSVDTTQMSATIDGVPVQNFDITNIPVSVFAGSHPTVTIKLPVQGTVTANVTGIVNALGASQAIPYESMTISVTSLDGLNRTVTTAKAGASSFKFSDSAGQYRITVTAPNFQSSGPVDVTLIADNPNVTTNIALQINHGKLILLVKDGGGSTLTGTTVKLIDKVTNQEVANTTDTGNADLFPGPYRLSIRMLDVTDPNNPVDTMFPVIVDLNLPTGDGTQQLDVVATLLALGGAIDGQVVAKNADQHEVPLPDSMTVARSFNGNKVSINSTTVPNAATEGDLSASAQPGTQVDLTRTAAGTTKMPYHFSNVEAGVHTLKFTFSPAGGYTPPADKTSVDAAIAAATVPDAVYTANNVTVPIHLDSDLGGGRLLPLDNMIVKLTPHWTDDLGPHSSPDKFTATGTGNGNYTVSLPPEVEDYTVVITDNPAVPVVNTIPEQTLTVPVSTTGTQATTSYKLTPVGTRITGVLRKQDSATGGATNFTGQQVSIYGPDNPSILAGTATTDGSGIYQFVVGLAGNYVVSASISGYTPASKAVNNVVLGPTVNVPDITVFKYASITFAMKTGGTTIPSGDNPRITMTDNGVVGTPCAPTSCDFSQLDATHVYSWSFSADTSYFSQVYPTTGTYTPQPGSRGPAPQPNPPTPATPVTINMVRRSITVSLTAEGDDAAKTAATAAGIKLNNVTLPDSAALGVHTLTQVPLAGGTVTVTMNTAGYRSAAYPTASPTGSITVPSVLATSTPPATPPDFPISIKQLAIIQGTVKVGTNGLNSVVVELVNGSGTVVATDTTSGGGKYSFDDGATPTPNGVADIGTYTVRLKDNQRFFGSSTVTVTASSATTDTGHDVAAARSTANFDFKVTDTSATAISGAAVNFNGITPVKTTDGQGKVSYTAVDVTDTLPITVTKSGFVDYTDPDIPYPLPQSPYVIQLAAVPHITGVTQINGTTTGNLKVYVCDPSVVATCTSVNASRNVTSNASTGAYDIPLSSAVGTYHLLAGDANGNASSIATLTLDRAGTVTFTSGTSTLSVTVPTHNYTFNVTESDGTTKIDGANVTFAGQGPSPTVGGSVTFNGVLDTASMSFTVTKANRVDYAGTATVGVSPVPVSLAPIPTVSGTTQVAGVVTGGLTVYVCDPDHPTCDVANSYANVTSDTTAGASLGTFTNLSLGSKVGIYRVFAKDATHTSAVTQITLNRAGTASPASGITLNAT